eukprot:g4624.t1
MSGLDLDSIKLLCTGAICGLLSAYVLRKLMTSYQNRLGTEEYLREIEFAYCEMEGLDQVGKLEEFSGLEFIKKCALLCEKHTMCLQDFTGESTEPLCLNIGCSVGGTTFELSKWWVRVCSFRALLLHLRFSFPYVLGIDPSKELISIAEELRDNKKITYKTESSNSDSGGMETVYLDPNLELDGVQFQVDDPCALAKSLAPVDCILVSNNILNRLHSPKELLKSLPRLLKNDGTVVLVTEFQWDSKITPTHQKIGDYFDKEGNYVRSEVELLAFMSRLGFQLIHVEDLPFIKKINARRFELHITQATVWKKAQQT